MSWKHLKSFAIVILLVINVFFLCEIRSRVFAENHYDAALSRSAISVFRESELYVDERFLSEKIVSFPAYRGNSDDLSRLDPIMEKLSYHRQEAMNGIRYAGDEGAFFFGDDFSFSYFEKAGEQMPSEVLENGGDTLFENKQGASRAERAVRSFLSRHGLVRKNADQYAYEIQTETVYSSGENFVVRVKQCVGDLALFDGVDFLVRDGRIVAADGLFVPVTPNKRMKSETMGLMDILFEEKAFFDEQYRESGSVSRERRILSDVSYSYEAYLGTDGIFYFVPTCELSYSSGEVRRYNMVSGKICLS